MWFPATGSLSCFLDSVFHTNTNTKKKKNVVKRTVETSSWEDSSDSGWHRDFSLSFPHDEISGGL